jgi:predicted N-acetyltransferase YhbS
VRARVPMGDGLHLAGLAVHPDFGRRGIGAALVQRVLQIARDRALAGVILTTFDDLPWNGPFYRRLGFRVLAERDLSPFLAATLQRERAAGMQERVAMLAEIGLQRQA